MKYWCMVIAYFFLNALLASAQSTQYQVGPILDKQLQAPDVVTFQLQ
jgi:hypothetical protein